jgi:antitoxin component HigA of HigAB toxin-antitoxin module
LPGFRRAINGLNGESGETVNSRTPPSFGPQLESAKVTGLDALQHLLEAHDMSAADLARLLDVHRTLGAMILRGERQLMLAHVRTLAKHFSVSADLFLS